MKFIFNRKKQVPKIQKRILRENGTESIELMEAFNFNKSTIQVSEIVSEADILYLNIESDVSVLLLDFKDAQDYRVLFLNDNYWTVGSTFALNNENGFVIQTRYKKILLMRYSFHLKRIEPKVYVHPPRSNIKKDILITVKTTSGNRLFSKTLKDWSDVEIDGFMTTLRVVVFSSKDGDVVKKYHFQKAYVEHEHELIGVKSLLYKQNIDNIDAKKSIEIIFVNPWSAEVFRELLRDFNDLDIDKFMDTNYITVQASKDNYLKTHYFWFKGRNPIIKKDLPV
jgi:hypothetical protein